MSASQISRCVSKGFSIPEPRDEFGLIVSGLNPQELAKGGRSRYRVRGQPGVSLELCERAGRSIPKNSIDSPGVEPEPTETLLEVGDVVAAHHRAAPVQEAVAERKAGFDERRPGLSSAHSVDTQAPSVLERLEGGARCLSKDAGWVRADAESQLDQAPLDVCDSFADAALQQRKGRVDREACGWG